MKKPKPNKRPRVQRLHLTFEEGRLGRMFCLSLVIQHQIRAPYFKSYDAQETMDEVVEASEKYNLKADFKLVQQIQNPTKN